MQTKIDHRPGTLPLTSMSQPVTETLYLYVSSSVFCWSEFPIFCCLFTNIIPTMYLFIGTFIFVYASILPTQLRLFNFLFPSNLKFVVDV